MELLNQVLVIIIAIGWSLLAFLILKPLRSPNAPVPLLRKFVAAVLIMESFWVLWVGLTRPTFGKTFGFLGLAAALWLIDLLTYRSQVTRRQSDA